MNRTKVMLRIVEMAEAGGHMPPDVAISLVAVMIDRLDMSSEHYERDLSALLGVGATIWAMANAAGSTPESGDEPPIRRA